MHRGDEVCSSSRLAKGRAGIEAGISAGACAFRFTTSANATPAYLLGLLHGVDLLAKPKHAAGNRGDEDAVLGYEAVGRSKHACCGCDLADEAACFLVSCFACLARISQAADELACFPTRACGCNGKGFSNFADRERAKGSFGGMHKHK